MKCKLIVSQSKIVINIKFRWMNDISDCEMFQENLFINLNHYSFYYNIDEIVMVMI